MLSSALRVLARAAAIQLEEAAAAAAVSSKSQTPTPTSASYPSVDDKGKGKKRAVTQDIPDDIEYETLSQALDRANQQRNVIKETPVREEKKGERKQSALDRMIAQSPRQNPPPAPSTPPKPPGSQNMRSRASSNTDSTPSSSSSASATFAKGVRAEKSKDLEKRRNEGRSALNKLIDAAPRSPPPPASSTPPRPPARQAMRQSAQSSAIEPSSTSTSAGLPSLQSDKSAIPSSQLSTSATGSAVSNSLLPKPNASPSPSAVTTSASVPPATPIFKEDAPPSQVDTSTNSAPLKLDVLQHPSIEVTPSVYEIKQEEEVLPAPVEEEDAPVILRASKVPSSRIGRLFHYGSLAASLSFGAASESIRRSTGGNQSGGSVFMSDANVRRLVATLGRMRGAALKLGQFMSIQDNNMLPPEIEKVLHQVQAHANYMPDWQMERVMRDELGSDWQSLFSTFDRTPVAAASIGQVHRAVLASTNLPVAVKIQFPGVASSIESDLANISLLLRSSALLPKGLYLQNTIAVMKRELEDECDYVLEAAAGKRFSELLKGDEFFVVPKVVDEATTGKVLTTEWMDGKPLSRVRNLSQKTRDEIGTNILRLCLQELFQFRFMQTDPNWGNFMYSTSTEGMDQIQLIDFGASRAYTKEFMDGWYRLLKSALDGDRVGMKRESEALGYLTGEENEVMLNAHLDSMALVASPFAHEGKYEFATQTITQSIRGLIPIMLKHRLTPPPQETYSLNRKLSGAFLMCAKLGARVDCQKLWEECVGGYKEG